jgi:hypothetical protein
MRKTLFVALLTLTALPLAAQQPPPALRFPRASQKAVVTQTVGLTDITITYSRPGVKGRKIWGALVPYGQVWRTGANDATTIAFSEDVTIGGQKVPKGTYSLHTIPGPDEWVIAINSVDKQWGSFAYDKSKDVVRVTAKPEKAPFTEWMTFSFPDISADEAKIVLQWENLAVPFKVNTGTSARVAAAAREALSSAKADDWQTPYRAAAWAYENNRAADAAKWLDQSLKAKETLPNLFLKARMQAATDKKAAIATAEKALSLATEADKDFASEIRKTVEGWKK